MIDKIDLAPAVGADHEVVRRDRPFVFTNPKSSEGVAELIAWIGRNVLFL